MVFDATFIRAYSKLDLHDNSRGSSDPEARVGRNDKTHELDYKLHLAVDAKSELPLAITVAPANDNEKKHTPELFKKALKATRKKKATDCGFAVFLQSQQEQDANTEVRMVISYPANEMRGKEGLLRTDRFFRTHGSKWEKWAYRLRSSVKRVNSRLKEQLCLKNHKVRSMLRITVHCLLCHV